MKRMIVGWLCLLVCMQGCTEFLEESIDDRVPALLSPGEQAETNNYLVTFRWEPLEYALQYQLQVASPSFENAAVFYADTVMDAVHFSLNLEPGHFEWRLRALNGSSQTPYVTRSFVVYEGALSKQQISLQDPTDQLSTALERMDFSWLKLFGATQYTLQLNDGPFNGNEDEVLKEETLSGLKFSYSVADEGTYYWRVKGSNDTATSKWSAVRQFQVDRTAPQLPALQLPANNQQASIPVKLQWSDQGDAAAYQLYVYKSDSVSLFNARFPLKLTTNSYSFSSETTSGERVLWRVRATDKAGNISDFSAWRSFIAAP